jgi:hypothetical protein
MAMPSPTFQAATPPTPVGPKLIRSLDPPVTLTAADGGAEDRFGSAVAISGDTIIVGAPSLPEGPKALPGVAYVYSRQGGTWTQQARLVPADSAIGDSFGWAVALAGDTAVITAPSGTGAAYVYSRSGTLWSLQAKLQPDAGTVGGHFGAAVALSGDTIVIGAPRQDSDRGAAYVYTRSGTGWQRQARILAVDGEPDDAFGMSVALSGDTALIGAAFDIVGAIQGQGSAYVYTRNGTVWTPQARLTAQDGGLLDQFGRTVALAGDTALVSAPGAVSGGGLIAPKVYVYTRRGGDWAQQAQLQVPGGSNQAGFTPSIALSGNTALIGFSAATVGLNPQQGKAFVFVRTGSTWNPRVQLVAADGEAEDRFGFAVALDGDTAVIGAPVQRIVATGGQGAAYVYTGVAGLTAPLSVTTLDPRALWLLLVAIGLIGLIVLRRP